MKKKEKSLWLKIEMFSSYLTSLLLSGSSNLSFSAKYFLYISILSLLVILILFANQYTCFRYIF